MDTQTYHPSATCKLNSCDPNRKPKKNAKNKYVNSAQIIKEKHQKDWPTLTPNRFNLL